MNETSSPPTPGGLWHSKFSVLLGWTFAFFTVVWLLDFPKPMVDDLAYCGAALNLAEGSDLSNPLLSRYQLPGHLFAICPPLHSYMLAGWLKIFGISAGAVTGFVAATYFITAVSTILILQGQASPILLWLVPLGVSTAFSGSGLRPEPMSAALTMLGFALFTRGGRWPGMRWIAIAVLGLGASTAPRLMVFSAALGVFALDTLRRETTHAPGIGRWRIWGPLAFGGVVSLGAFLTLIGFRLGEFWRTFHFVGKSVTANKLSRVIAYFNENPFLNNAQFPLVLLTVGLFVFAWPPRRCDHLRLSLFLVGGFLASSAMGLLGSGTLWYIVLILFFMLTAIIKQRPELGPKLKVVICLALLLANVEVPLIAYGQVRGKISTSRGPDAAQARELRSNADHTVLVDFCAARYEFNYRIPPGFLDMHFAAPFPLHFTIDDMHPGDIYLATPASIESLNQTTALNMPVKTWRPFGLANRNYYVEPCRVYVIPSENCVPRTKAGS